MRVSSTNQYPINKNPGFKMNLISVPEENAKMLGSLKKALFRMSPNKDAYLTREAISSIWQYVLRCNGKIAISPELMSATTIRRMARKMKPEIKKIPST